MRAVTITTGFWGVIGQEFCSGKRNQRACASPVLVKPCPCWSSAFRNNIRDSNDHRIELGMPRVKQFKRDLSGSETLSAQISRNSGKVKPFATMNALPNKKGFWVNFHYPILIQSGTLQNSIRNYSLFYITPTTLDPTCEPVHPTCTYCKVVYSEVYVE